MRCIRKAVNDAEQLARVSYDVQVTLPSANHHVKHVLLLAASSTAVKLVHITGFLPDLKAHVLKLYLRKFITRLQGSTAQIWSANAPNRMFYTQMLPSSHLLNPCAAGTMMRCPTPPLLRTSMSSQHEHWFPPLFVQLLE